ncbi:nitrile hydratase subunit alpha [Sorangium sp. So ce131]|uniref:nitrile hydratase subunit alpha n=1 Tax=Sorangium sp. So ce131 TaxID=3133282 RepID=UPI003F637B57
MTMNTGSVDDAFEGWSLWTSAWLRAVNKAWREPDFQKRLLADARAAMGEVGYAVPPGLDLKVVEVADRADAEQRLPDVSITPAVFSSSSKVTGQSLTLGLPKPPDDLADGLVVLGDHSSKPTPKCFCACG